MLADKLKAVSKTSKAVGQVAFTSPGSYSWTVPANVTSICAVCVGGGGGGSASISTTGSGGGGGLAYVNDLAVTPGSVIGVIVGKAGAGGVCNSGTITFGSNGGASSITLPDGSNVIAFGGLRGDIVAGSGNIGSSTTTPAATVFKGGDGSIYTYPSGGGGAAGYAGDGGAGAGTVASATPGSGGGGGGGGRTTYSAFSNRINTYGGRGGGVGIFGQGSSGVGGPPGDSANNYNGYPGGNGSSGSYGGGGGSCDVYQTASNQASVTAGSGGAVRIIWGPGRAFPSTLTADRPVVN